MTARLRFAILGSGSKGNATLVECGETRLLVDCGFSMAEAKRRLARLELAPDDLSAILVTHEHSDHVGGVARLAGKYQIPVFISDGTRLMCPSVTAANAFDSHAAFELGDIEVTPVIVPHDAREPTQFLFSDGRARLGLLTDTGRSTPHIERFFARCDSLILETNHDESMLMGGPYPHSLKRRVGGPLGHLSNAQSAELLGRLETVQLKHLVAAHLSENNNSPAHAREALAAVLGCGADEIEVARQETGLGWREVAG